MSNFSDGSVMYGFGEKRHYPVLRDFYNLQSKETTQEPFQDFFSSEILADREMKISFMEWYNPG